jgi:glycosyltransferase involved in cell wall biosynthesis
MKRLLIVSDPPAAPGYLPRVRFLCEYFVQKGFDVTLLTEQYQPLVFDHSYSIQTIPMYSGGRIDWLIKTIWTLLTDWHNRAFARKAINYPFDYVICSAFSDFPLGASLRIAKALNVPLICDIRDLDEQVDDSRYQYKHQSRWLMPFRRIYRAIHIRRRNNVLRKANAITTVSPWHADFIRTFNTNVQVVYNGYDPKQFYPENIPTDRFTITYIGSLFEWQKPALEIVKQVIEEMNLPSVLLDIHTPQNNPIPHNGLGDAIRRSGIMLVLTNVHTHGMLTTKFYEALGCEKPVLCVPSDQGSLAELIHYTNAGIATDDKEAIKAFILAQYTTWQQNHYTRQATKHREIFSRENQYDQYYRTYIQR